MCAGSERRFAVAVGDERPLETCRSIHVVFKIEGYRCLVIAVVVAGFAVGIGYYLFFVSLAHIYFF